MKSRSSSSRKSMRLSKKLESAIKKERKAREDLSLKILNFIKAEGNGPDIDSLALGATLLAVLWRTQSPPAFVSCFLKQLSDQYAEIYLMANKPKRKPKKS